MMVVARLGRQNVRHSHLLVLSALVASTANNSASAFSLHRANTNGGLRLRLSWACESYRSCRIQQVERTRQKHLYHCTRRFLQLGSSNTLIEDDDVIQLFDEEENDEDEGEDSLEAPVEIIHGASDGMIVTEYYTMPLEGFQEVDEPSLSTIFSPDDIKRLSLNSKNVTLPAALMLLDPNAYATQSRARKVIRQRTICICRAENTNSASFPELGKVITRIYPGDRIGVQKNYMKSNYYALEGVPFRPPPFDLPVVFEDDHMAIVNKPAGVVTYRADGYKGSTTKGGHGRDTLLSALPYFLEPSKFTPALCDDDDDEEPSNNVFKRPQPVHRLDRPTSGLVIIAKTKAAAVHLSQQFEYRKTRKTYHAIVNGEPKFEEGNNAAVSSEWNTIDYELDGKTAITEWRVIRQIKSLHGNDGKLSLVELKPKTGRYHQLRRHMAWVCNSPLVGDTTYDGGDASALRLRGRGLFLTSNEIELEHPYYNKPIGRKDWVAMGQKEIVHGDTVLVKDDETGNVIVKASVALPNKFESFMTNENFRAIKFGEVP